MTPWKDRAKEGRINPKGIPCLYTATDKRTAMSEVKPAIGSYLTLAEFVTEKDLKVVDFASERIDLSDADLDNLTKEQQDSIVWEDLNDAFSEPVTDSDNIADYAPTQIIAELFKIAGYDGMRYKSKVMEFRSVRPEFSKEFHAENIAAGDANVNLGLNLALFDINAATFKSSALYQFKMCLSGYFDFARVGQTVFCSEQIPYDENGR